MFTFGETARKNDREQKGTMFIDADCSVTNAVDATWSVSNLVVMGELVVRGTLSVPNSVVFSNGASFVVGALLEGGVVLSSASIKTNGALSVSVIGDGTEYAVSVIENADGTDSLVLTAGVPTEVTVPVTVQRYADGEWSETTLECVLPTGWLTNYYPAASTSVDMVSQYLATSANGAAVWQCYMLGLDPTNAESTVSLLLAVVDGQIHFDVCGLGETHAIDGITAYWYLMTSTDLASDPSFSNERECVTGLVPTFSAHSVPDTVTADSAGTESRLFYKITVSFVAE